MSEAQEITRKAKSNLAFALLSLPKENRDDVTIFYAFCRVIDDIADDPNNPAEEKCIDLDHWQGLFHNKVAQPTQLEESILALQQRHNIPREHFLDLIEGCRMDLEPQRFETWSDLQTYTHRVASTVGLVCLPLFGSQHPEAPAYATKLGHALQLTNILRDVAEDLENEDRVYLPLEDMRRFDYTEQDLRNRVYDERFQKMMHYQGQRANQLFAETIALHPSSDRKSLMAAEIMRSLYQTLLERMQDDDFRVFDQRYKLSKARKIATLVTHGLRTHFAG